VFLLSVSHLYKERKWRVSVKMQEQRNGVWSSNLVKTTSCYHHHHYYYYKKMSFFHKNFLWKC